MVNNSQPGVVQHTINPEGGISTDKWGGDFRVIIDTGAFVVAAVRRPEREKYARVAGAHEVVIGEEPSAAHRFGPYDLIIESVGGRCVARGGAQNDRTGRNVRAARGVVGVRDNLRRGHLHADRWG
jgi:hypothetical protein